MVWDRNDHSTRGNVMKQIHENFTCTAGSQCTDLSAKKLEQGSK